MDNVNSLLLNKFIHGQPNVDQCHPNNDWCRITRIELLVPPGMPAQVPCLRQKMI